MKEAGRLGIVFNPVHPPFIDSIKALPPVRTDAGFVSEAIIEKRDFDFVVDPAFNWQGMPTVTQAERDRRQQVREDKASKIRNYLILREQFWQQTERLQFAEDTDYELTTTTGVESTRQITESETSTSTIGISLGLQLDGSLFNPAAAAPVVAARAEDRNAKEQNGPSASGSAEFTYQLSQELRFERMDSTTYRKETVTSVRTQFKARTLYLKWSLCESLTLYRIWVLDARREFVSTVVAATAISWTDAFCYGPPSSGE